MVVMLTTTAIALAAAGAALLFTDLRDNRAAWAADLGTEAAILSLAVQPALSFDDREGAQRNLNALQARASIRAAALYGADGRLFAQYVRAGETSAPSLLPPLSPGAHIDGGRVELMRHVVQGGETLGTIYLRAHYDVSGRVRAYLSVLGAVMVIGLIAALLASSWLQRVVSQPMESMANVARQIVEERDYSFRAAQHHQRRDRRGGRRVQQHAGRSAVALARARDQREAVSRHRRVHQLRRLGHATPRAATSIPASPS